MVLVLFLCSIKQSIKICHTHELATSHEDSSQMIDLERHYFEIRVVFFLVYPRFLTSNNSTLSVNHLLFTFSHVSYKQSRHGKARSWTLQLELFYTGSLMYSWMKSICLPS